MTTASTQREITDLFVELESRARRFKENVGMAIMESVREKTPVKTGALQNSYGFDIKKTAIELWSTKDYFDFIENGTMYIAPRKMMARTLLEIESITQAALEKSKK